MKVLLVEDDPLMAELYHNILTFENHQVELAADGQEALDKIKTSAPDLILLDIMMPRMDGMQVLDHLKNSSSTKDIPVIILTNLMDQEKAEECLRKGALRYIVKSDYNPDQVMKIITETMSKVAKTQPEPSH